MPSEVWTALAAVVGVIITAIAAPWLKQRRDERAADEQEVLEARAAAKAAVAVVDANRETWWREEIESLRETWQRENATLRDEVDRLRSEVDSLRQEVSEYRFGLRAAVGFVLVPTSVWQEVRTRLPDLPPGRFPGEGRRHTDHPVIDPPGAHNEPPNGGGSGAGPPPSGA